MRLQVDQRCVCSLPVVFLKLWSILFLVYFWLSHQLQKPSYIAGISPKLYRASIIFAQNYIEHHQSVSVSLLCAREMREDEGVTNYVLIAHYITAFRKYLRIVDTFRYTCTSIKMLQLLQQRSCSPLKNSWIRKSRLRVSA